MPLCTPSKNLGSFLKLTISFPNLYAGFLSLKSKPNISYIGQYIIKLVITNGAPNNANHHGPNMIAVNSKTIAISILTKPS